MTEARRTLDGLEWRPAWISHMGCHHACIEYLGLDISRAWIYGGTGHAFALNIHEELCPSGPTAWDTRPVDHLAGNVGYLVEGVTGDSSQRDFEARQKIAWALVTGCIDTGVPCYGWELAMPEWYVITGYDDGGYYFSGPGADGAHMPIAPEDLAKTEIGWLSMHCVVRCTPSPDHEVVVEAIDFTLANAAGEHLLPHYAAGAEAFDVWADALKSGTANRFGAGYNGEAWRECRAMAVEFLMEARERVGREQALFDEALEHYSAVCDALGQMVERIPFCPPGEADEEEPVQDAEAAEILREAKSAEQRGLDALQALGEALRA